MIDLVAAAAHGPERVGIKAAMLSRAVEQGFDVPAGVVIPPDAPVAAEDIARILGAVRFAVRSSAPDEDTSTSSMAGRYCTLLEVDAAGLDAAIEAVRRGFGAGSTPGTSHPESPVPVLVQVMVDPKIAGVGFSIDPVSGDGDLTTIEVVSGRGDTVTDGSVAPAVARRRLGADGMLVLECDDRIGRPEAERICDLVDDLAVRLGTPVDVEFAFDGMTLWLLQVRPVTAVGFGGVEGVWTTANLRDSLTDTVSTLTATTTLESIFPEAIERAVRTILNDRSGHRLVVARSMYARPFWRVDGLRSQMRRLPGHDPCIFDTSVGIEHDPNASQPAVGKWAALGYPGIVLRSVRYAYSVRRTAADCVTRSESVPWTERRHGYRGSPETLADRLDAVLREHRRVYLLSMQVSLIAEQTLDILRACAESVSTAERVVRPVELMSDLGDLATGRGARALASLADRHRESADLVVGASSLDDLPAAVYAGLRVIAERWGYLSFCDDELSNPRWDEDPTAPLALLQANLGRSATATEAEGRPVSSRYRRARRDLLRARWYGRAVFGSVLNQARSWAVLREDMRACAARQNYLLRAVCLELADRLVETGVLEARDDVFWLTADEASGASRFRDTEDLGARARNRRRRASMYRNWTVPESISNTGGLAGPAARSGAPGCDATDLDGVGCSSGIVEGRARVVGEPSDLAAVTRDDILVVRTVNPGWAAAFGCALGVVSENGGMLSHGAILAREHGVPAVVGVRGATTRIATGDILRIDGTSGKVTVR